MTGLIPLLAGISAVAATVGYMVGASATPVVSVAVPAVFGLVVTAIGLLQGSPPSKEYAELLRTAGAQAADIPEVAESRARAKSAPLRVGISLVAFCVVYLVAATVGAKVRIENVLAPTLPAQPFPWVGSTVHPRTIASALEWIALQSRLKELGYEDKRIKELYDIQVKEWDALRTQPPATDRSPSSGGVQEIIPEGKRDPKRIEFVLPEGMKGNPFANQPPKDLKDKLKDIRDPSRRVTG